MATIDQDTKADLLDLRNVIQSAIGASVDAILSYTVYDDGEIIGSFQSEGEAYIFTRFPDGRFTAEPTEQKTDSIPEFRNDEENLLLNIIERADKKLRGLEDSAIERINSALESAYQDLEAKIIKLYGQESEGSLFAKQRAAVIISQVADLLTLLNTRNADRIQQDLENLLRAADQQGTTLAQELTRAIANQNLQMTAQIPLDAIRNQAEEGMQRLRNHTTAFAEKASAVVMQGLIQGFGVDQIARSLRQELGIVQHRAETIARTESISALDAGTRNTYRQNQIDYVQRLGTLDDLICPLCVARIGNVYEVDEAPAAIHPRDRCYNLPFKFEWLELGLIDVQWMKQFKEGAIGLLRENGFEPDPGVAPFEKANGLEAPDPVWQLTNLDSDDWHEDKQCGKGWQGTKPPGCTRAKKGSSKSSGGSGGSSGGGGSAGGGEATTPAPKAKTTKKKTSTAEGGETASAATPKTKTKKATKTAATEGGEADATTPTKKKTTKKPAEGETATVKPTAKKPKAKKQEEAEITDTKGMYDALKKMGEGVDPDSIKLSKNVEEAAIGWMKKQFGYGDKNLPKIYKMQTLNPNISREEGEALALWLGSGYTQMSAQIWKKEANPNFKEDPSVLGASLLAAIALHKLPKQDANKVAERIENWEFTPKIAPQIKEDFTANGWNRFMKIDNPEKFIAKYQEGQEITESNFMGITHLPPEKMSFFSSGANVAYKITPKLDGNGAGKYVDDLKNSAQEGEILYPPSTKFKVKKVTKVENANYNQIGAPSTELHTPIAKLFDQVALEKGWGIGVSSSSSVKQLKELTGAKSWKELETKKEELIKKELTKAKKQVAKAKKQAETYESESKKIPGWSPMYASNGYLIELEEI